MQASDPIPKTGGERPHKNRSLGIPLGATGLQGLNSAEIKKSGLRESPNMRAMHWRPHPTARRMEVILAKPGN